MMPSTDLPCVLLWLLLPCLPAEPRGGHCPVDHMRASVESHVAVACVVNSPDLGHTEPGQSCDVECQQLQPWCAEHSCPLCAAAGSQCPSSCNVLSTCLECVVRLPLCHKGTGQNLACAGQPWAVANNHPSSQTAVPPWDALVCRTPAPHGQHCRLHSASSGPQAAGSPDVSGHKEPFDWCLEHCCPLGWPPSRERPSPGRLPHSPLRSLSHPPCPGRSHPHPGAGIRP